MMPLRAALVSATLACVVHLSLYHAEFVWDDRAAVKGNDDLRQETPWSSLLKHDFWGQNITLPSSHKSFRPITVATFRMNHLIGGLDPSGYHLVNVALHSVNTMLVVALAAFLGLSSAGVWMTGILFAVHPVHVEAVASVVCRADLLACMFFLLALFTHARACQCASEGRAIVSFAYHLGSMLLTAIAVCSKETGITVIGAMCLWELCPPRARTDEEAFASRAPQNDDHGAPSRTTSPPARRRSPRRQGSTERSPQQSQAAEPGLWEWLTAGWRPWHTASDKDRPAWAGIAGSGMQRVGVMAALVATLVALRLRLHEGAPLYKWRILENQMSVMEPGLPRALTTWYSHARAFGLLVWPWNLSFDHGFAAATPVLSVADPRTVASLATYAVLVAAIAAAMWRRRMPALWGLGVAIGTYFPASNVPFYVGTEVAERLLYLPSVGFLIAVADGVTHWAQHDPSAEPEEEEEEEERKAQPRVWRIRVVKIVVGVIAAWMAALSYRRTLDWQSEFQLYKSGLDTYPTNIKALNNVGLMMKYRGDEGDLEGAEAYLRRAIAIFPEQSAPKFNLGLVRQDLHDRQGGLYWLWRALETDIAKSCSVLLELGNAYLNMHISTRSPTIDAWARAAGGPAARSFIAHRVLAAGSGGVVLSSETPAPVEDWEDATQATVEREWPAPVVPLQENESKDRWAELLGRPVPDALQAHVDRVRPLDVARRLIEFATGCEEKSPSLYYARGTLSLELRSPSGAAQEYERALQAFARTDTDPSSTGRTWSMLAVAYEAMGRLEDAQAAHRRAVEVLPGQAAPHSNWGNLLDRLGQKELALEQHFLAAQADPNDGLVQNNLGWALEQAGRLTEALARYQAALQLVGNHPQIVRNVARVNMKMQGQ